jgi:LPS export ABC transporter protein LptC
MRKLPFVILACVALFLVGIVGLLVARSRAPRPPEALEPAPSKAEYRIKEVRLEEHGKDGTQWQLDAEYGEIFEKQGKTSMGKVTVRVTQPSRQWKLSGDQGELYQATKDVELRGNVVLESSDGLRVETERVNWTAKDERAWGDEPVTIRYGEGVTIQGRGFEVRSSEAAATVKGRVRATLIPGKLNLPNEKLKLPGDRS